MIELEVRTDSICHLLVHVTHDFADHEFPFKFVRLPVPAAAAESIAASCVNLTITSTRQRRSPSQ